MRVDGEKVQGAVVKEIRNEKRRWRKRGRELSM